MLKDTMYMKEAHLPEQLRFVPGLITNTSLTIAMNNVQTWVDQYVPRGIEEKVSIRPYLWQHADRIYRSLAQTRPERTFPTVSHQQLQEQFARYRKPTDATRRSRGRDPIVDRGYAFLGRKAWREHLQDVEQQLRGRNHPAIQELDTLVSVDPYFSKDAGRQNAARLTLLTMYSLLPLGEDSDTSV